MHVAPAVCGAAEWHPPAHSQRIDGSLCHNRIGPVLLRRPQKSHGTSWKTWKVVFWVSCWQGWDGNNDDGVRLQWPRELQCSHHRRILSLFCLLLCSGCPPSSAHRRCGDEPPTPGADPNPALCSSSCSCLRSCSGGRRPPLTMCSTRCSTAG